MVTEVPEAAEAELGFVEEDPAAKREREEKAAAEAMRQAAAVQHAKDELAALLRAPLRQEADGEQQGEADKPRARPIALVKPFIKADMKVMKADAPRPSSPALPPL